MTNLFDHLPEQGRPLRELPPRVMDNDWRAPDELPTLSGVRRIALDLETKDTELSDRGPGCRRPGNYIVGIAVGIDRGPRCYLPIRHEGGGNLDPRLVLNWARRELGQFDGEVVGANILYDLDWLATEGIELKNVRRFLDVQVAEPLLDENRLQFGLEYLARDWLGEGKYEHQFDELKRIYRWKTNKALKQNLWKLPARLVGPYAEGDVDLPLRILPHQLKQLEEEDLLPLFDIECRLIPLLLAMRRRGVRVDEARAERLRGELVGRQKALRERLRALCGPTADFTLPDTLADSLMAAGVPVPRTPKAHRPSITKELLEKYQHVPLATLIREGRQLGTIISTFLDGSILGHAINGRIHCEFNQLKRDEGGTIARFSSSNPNLQNIPARDEELAPLIRGLFIPEEGEVWERKDLSQIEYRFLVHYARGEGADEARAAYHADPGLSFHKLAGSMLGLTDFEGPIYKRVKNTNFCKVYGGGVPKLAATFGCSLEEARAFNEQYEAALPFVTKTFEEADKLAQRRGYIKTILKRRRRFPLFEPAKFGDQRPPLPHDQAQAAYGRIRRAGTRNALNGMLQGGAADYLKKAMVDIWEAGLCDVMGPPLVTVHDELGDSVPLTPAGEEASREAQHLFNHAIKLRVPIFSERSRGANWGECK